MTIHHLHAANWTAQLADLIGNAADGDTIVVSNEAQAELAAMAHDRMCPAKRLIFEVNSDALIDALFGSTNGNGEAH